MAVIDLSQLPPPQIVDVPDFETLLSERAKRNLSRYFRQKKSRRPWPAPLALESEPVGKMLQENV